MDERLKQRLVGATVVVALAVIIIPELLEQPEAPPAPAASLTVPEPPPVREQPVITLSREPEQPVPVLPDTPPASNGEGQVLAGEGEMPFATDEVPPLVTEVQEPPLPTGSAIAGPPPVEEAMAEEDPEPPPLARQQPPPVPTPPPVAKPTPPPARPTPPAQVAEAPPRPAPPVPLPRIELQGRSQGPVAAPPPPPTQVARAEPTPAPAPAPAPARPAPARSSGSQGWMIQVGSFSRQENADLQREQLASAGYSVKVESTQINGRTLYRVRVGPQGSRSESERVLARLLRETGVNGQVVAPD